MTETFSVFTKNYNELNFTVEARVHSHWVEFNIYEVIGWVQGPDGEWNVPTWISKDETRYDVPIDEARVFAHGSVKWDGCSNWTFTDNAEGVMIHGCSRADVRRIGDILGICWDLTAELCENWYERL